MKESIFYEITKESKQTNKQKHLNSKNVFWFYFFFFNSERQDKETVKNR